MKYSVDSYIILNKKVGLIICVYIMIIIVITLSLIIFLTLFHYKTYYKVKGIVENKEEDYYIRTYIPLENINYIIDNDILRINKKNYKYIIDSIDDQFAIYDFITYQIVLIKVDIPSKYKFNNLNLELQFLKEDKKVLDYILRR